MVENSITYGICDEKMNFARMLQYILFESSGNEFLVNIGSVKFSVRCIKSGSKHGCIKTSFETRLNQL